MRNTTISNCVIALPSAAVMAATPVAAAGMGHDMTKPTK